MLREIDALDGDVLLNTNPDALSDYFVERFRAEASVPIIREDGIHVDPLRHVERSSADYHAEWFGLQGTAITYHLPFEGDPEVFKFKPSKTALKPPRGRLEGNEIRITVEVYDKEANEGERAGKLKQRFKNELAKIQSHLESARSDITAHNASLPQLASQRIDALRRKLLADRQLVGELGYPLRPRRDAPMTYVVPTVRRKPRIERPSPAKTPFTPEPTLAMEEYDQVLSLMGNVGRAMELSPSLFRAIDEEDLRTHFLIQLNGQYEAQATGETFNLSGKTDIIIRERDRNLFIAECKFWRGPKSLSEAIDQLLGYTSWRDTKTAILLFNTTRHLSAVLAKVPEVVHQHPNFRRQLTYKSETGFRFLLHHRDDPGRELVLTVLLFEVPI
jgi:hypothetical protein